MWSKLKQLFRRNQVDPEFWDELETTLLTADVGPELTQQWLLQLRPHKTVAEVMQTLKSMLCELLQPLEQPWQVSHRPHVILVLGVNGVGKTTSIAKVAYDLKRQGKSVLLVAADTFRAAAVEQLQTWGERLQVPVIAQAMGADPAAVAFDGVQAAIARGVDVVLIDTAGRLHTKDHLMAELRKIQRVTDKALAGVPHDVWCVLDATVGQNAVQQVQQFHAAIPLTGLIVTKWDGEAKAGAVCGVAQHCPVPIRYVGTGERVENLEPFVISAFVERLIA